MPSLNKLSGPLEEYYLPPCVGEDPDIFIAHRKISKAKRICMTCPEDARRECLKKALSDGERLGVRGGLSADDRLELQERLNAKAEERCRR